MSADNRLDLRQSQRLVLSPALQQSLKILQLPAVELKEYIDEELEKNPALETAEKEVELPNVDAVAEDGSFDMEKIAEHLERESTADYGEAERDRNLRRETNYENTARNSYSLEEHLLWQLQLSAVDEADYKIGEYLIGNINDDGYLLTTISEAALALMVSEEKVNEVLKLVQSFEPTGVGAQGLSECLQIQLKAKGGEGTLAWKLVTVYWEDFEKGHLDRIAEKEKVPMPELYRAVEAVSKLEPKPGGEVSDSEVRYIVPDVLVEKDENGGYRISINNEGVPFLKISKFYREMSRKKTLTGEEKKFLKDKFASAVWVINAIGQRKKTLLKVTGAIIEAQKDFLEYGIDSLKPLALKEISEKVSLHQSTVSRVTAGKYVMTPKGIFPFRFFFNVKIEKGEGEPGIAARTVKDAIKDIVKADREGTMSDSRIQIALDERGFRVSRRTVAKYREELKLLPAAKRKILGSMKGGSL